MNFLILSNSICSSGTWQYSNLLESFLRKILLEVLLDLFLHSHAPTDPIRRGQSWEIFTFCSLKTNKKKIRLIFPPIYKKKKVFKCILIRLKLSPCVCSLNLSIFNCLCVLASCCHGKELWFSSASLSHPLPCLLPEIG